MKQFVAILLTVIVLLTAAVYCQPFDETEALDETAMAEVGGALSNIGYAVTITEETQDFLHGERYRLVLDNEAGNVVTVYAYRDAKASQKEADCITDDGCGLDYVDKLGNGQGVRVEWISEPHFFLYQNLIVQYIGTDETILAALQNLCGQQIAGTPFFVPEPWMSQPASAAPEVFLEVLPDSVRSDGLTMNLVNNSDIAGHGVEVEYGEAFSLLQKVTMLSCGVSKSDEKQSVSDTTVTWEPVPMEWAFPDVAYCLSAGKQAELQVALPDLAPGEYRITKNIFYQQKGQNGSASFEVCADFVVPAEK